MTINSKDQREETKNKAVEIRESGDREIALEMFLEVEKWDEENKNITGQVDVLGHLRITYVRLADIAESEEKKKELRKKALQMVDKALSIVNKNKKEVSEGQVAITKVHLVSAQLSYSKHLEEKEKEVVLKEALKIINEAIEKLPGSEAHRSWPMVHKAEILYELGNTQEALDVLLKALRNIYDGYEDEIENDDQAELKLNVWISGVYLGLATICQREGKPILAKHYASSVLSLDDPKNHLGLRKEMAKRMLEEIDK